MSQETEKPDVSRREFLKTGAKAGAAGLTAFSGITFITNPERVFGANDRVLLGGSKSSRRCGQPILL